MDANPVLDSSNPALSVLPAEEERLPIGATGVTAQRKGEYVMVSNKEGTEIFSFHSRACPFEQSAIYFLIEIYTIGYNKGRVMGRDLFKAKIRDLLGPEI